MIDERNLVEKVILASSLACIAIYAAGCGVVSMPSPLQRGHVLVAGDAEGMRAFGDTLNGLVSEGKASADVKGSYWQHREATEAQETARAMKPSILENLFGGGKQ